MKCQQIIGKIFCEAMITVVCCIKPSIELDGNHDLNVTFIKKTLNNVELKHSWSASNCIVNFGVLCKKLPKLYEINLLFNKNVLKYLLNLSPFCGKASYIMKFSQPELGKVLMGLHLLFHQNLHLHYSFCWMLMHWGQSGGRTESQTKCM